MTSRGPRRVCKTITAVYSITAIYSMTVVYSISADYSITAVSMVFNRLCNVKSFFDVIRDTYCIVLLYYVCQTNNMK